MESGEKEARCHIQIILTAVLRILPADLSLELICVPSLCCNPFEVFQIVNLCLGVL